jgi:hypothetical protein
MRSGKQCESRTIDERASVQVSRTIDERASVREQVCRTISERASVQDDR